MRWNSEAPTMRGGAWSPHLVEVNNGRLAPQAVGLWSAQVADTQGNLPIVTELE